MNPVQLKKLLKGKSKNFLENILFDLYGKVPGVKDYLDIYLPEEVGAIERNAENLLKKYKKKIEDYIFHEDLNTLPDDERAVKLIERIRKKDIGPKFTIECELHYIESCKEFILLYGYFDEEFYMAMDEMFESVCKTIKQYDLIEEYRSKIDKLIAFGDQYGFEFERVSKDIVWPNDK